jgi:hypothetical protein
LAPAQSWHCSPRGQSAVSAHCEWTPQTVLVKWQKRSPSVLMAHKQPEGQSGLTEQRMPQLPLLRQAPPGQASPAVGTHFPFRQRFLPCLRRHFPFLQRKQMSHSAAHFRDLAAVASVTLPTKRRRQCADRRSIGPPPGERKPGCGPGHRHSLQVESPTSEGRCPSPTAAP